MATPERSRSSTALRRTRPGSSARPFRAEARTQFGSQGTSGPRTAAKGRVCQVAEHPGMHPPLGVLHPHGRSAHRTVRPGAPTPRCASPPGGRRPRLRKARQSSERPTLGAREKEPQKSTAKGEREAPGAAAKAGTESGVSTATGVATPCLGMGIERCSNKHAERDRATLVSGGRLSRSSDEQWSWTTLCGADCRRARCGLLHGSTRAPATSATRPHPDRRASILSHGDRE